MGYEVGITEMSKEESLLAVIEALGAALVDARAWAKDWQDACDSERKKNIATYWDGLAEGNRRSQRILEVLRTLYETSAAVASYNLRDESVKGLEYWEDWEVALDEARKFLYTESGDEGAMEMSGGYSAG